MTDDPRTVASDLAAERAVLAAAMLDAHEVIPRVSIVLNAEDFHDPRHAIVWRAIVAVYGRNEPIDLHTLTSELRAQDRLQAIGGAQFLGELTDAIPTVAHCETHARIVRDLSHVRRAREAYLAAAQRLDTGSALEAVQAELERRLHRPDGAYSAGLVSEDLDDLFTTVQARMNGLERPVQTPWSSVDALLGEGLWPGMYVLVGGTGSGKTQWAVQTAVRAAERGGRVLYLALELSRRDLAARVAGALTHTAWSDLLRGRLRPQDFDRAARMASEALRTMAFHTECAPPYGYSADTLAARAWTLRPSLVVLDYLQLCAGRAGEDPRQAVGRVSYVARSIARDLGAVVIVLSSTARTNYAELVNAPDRDPADLVGLGKESGEIEYAADGVLVLARHADRPTGRVLVVAKNRHGPLGRTELDWTGTAFVEPASNEVIGTISL